MHHVKHIFMMTWFLFIAGIVSVFGQLKFHVASFGEDQFDLAARDERFKKIDGSGSLYAIIKVSGDDLKEYNFNFGNMNHLVEEHNGKLWVYVQKNAKMVTIMRKGYTTIDKYDLHTTIEAGKTYVMQLSAQGPVIYTQMVMFQVKPADSKAVVTIKNASSDGEEIMLGMVDASGSVAKNLPYGTYTYRIISENYNSSEGRITLNNQNETHREEVTLRPRFSQITLTVDGGAEIWVNGEKKGTGTWTGPLNAGAYSVECRRTNHRSSTQSITVEENVPRTIALTPPTPIVGKLSLLSTPLGASIKIDGKDYGTTPRNISDLLIGKHTIRLNLEGYGEASQTVEVKEKENIELNLNMTRISANTEFGASGGSTFTVNNVSFVMMPVEGGTFQMGVKLGQGNDDDDYMKPISVTLNSYYIGQTVVTQALWTAVMGSNPSYCKGDLHPVDQVSWNDCQKFILKLNKLTGQKFRLPTEAEWEYAARGGKLSKGYKYSGSNTLDDVAWYDKNSDNTTHPVATKLPNELGIYDMSGNVYEWCQDWFSSLSYGSTQTNPTGPSSGIIRVNRGGCWGCNARDCRIFERGGYKPNGKLPNIGFRLALSE
ncbi:MAG: SUMF1/EgtB/PvdO family nonheme iron enzyme [Bacteroidaceae bacterium]|nr:SUMF1/EgtB/PvdO family nonheme iron enzyme [Bacteroidaceae bacterium]